MKFVLVISLSFFTFFLPSFAQQLVINEISQGTSNKEYVEFVVMGTSTCTTPVPCLDLRGKLLDDNDGSFNDTITGSGVAAGAVRFANITFWSCIPQGTIIVIYNNLDVNPALPASDVSMNDGNCRLIIPINSTLFEGQGVSPTSSNPYVYPSSGWVAGAGLWTQIGMQNSHDSFQIRNSISSVSASHSVSWGNNTLNNQIFFASASGAVFSMMNTSNNNPTVQANWVSGLVGTNETPGVGNNVANTLWIASMNPQCAAGAPILTVNLTATNETCAGLCNGAITTTVTNGVAPYTYVWTNGANSQNINNLCPGTYAVQVTDHNGCTQNASATILAGPTNANANVAAAGPFFVTENAITLQPVTSGGTWTSNCGSCLSNTGIFSPNSAGVGTFQICYTVGSGACAATECIDITVVNCPQIETNDTLKICPGETIDVFGQAVNTSGIFSHLFINSFGCDSIKYIVVQEHNTNSSHDFQTICFGDSVFVFGNWVAENQYLEQTSVDSNNCILTNSKTISVKDCSLEEFYFFVPNVFTPNNDGANDVFEIELKGGTVNNGLILNRWGEINATFDDANRIWNGKNRLGFNVSNGVYTYIIHYTPIGKPQMTAQGFVTLLR